MIESVLSEADDADLDERFTTVEQERELAGLHDRYDAEIACWEEELQRATFTHIVDLDKEVEPLDDGILTRMPSNDDDVKAMIFGFGQGQELSEHAEGMSAILHFIKGEATVVSELHARCAIVSRIIS